MSLLLTAAIRSEEHTSELQSRFDLVCRLLLEKKNVDERRMPWFASPFAQRWVIAVMFRDSGPTGFGAKVNSAPRLPWTPGVWNPFQVAVASSHPSVTWYAVCVFPSFVILSRRLASTIREPAGI